jgi:hypothetical protein
LPFAQTELESNFRRLVSAVGMLTWPLAEAKPVFPHGFPFVAGTTWASPETLQIGSSLTPSIMISCDASEHATEVGNLQVFQAP